jgi:hypothetical protein
MSEATRVTIKNEVNRDKIRIPFSSRATMNMLEELFRQELKGFNVSTIMNSINFAEPE